MACERERLDGMNAWAPTSAMGARKRVELKALSASRFFERKTADQALSLTDVVDLACSQDEADRIAEGIDANVDLRAQAAARTTDRLIFAPPFCAPAAC